MSNVVIAQNAVTALGKLDFDALADLLDDKVVFDVRFAPGGPRTVTGRAPTIRRLRESHAPFIFTNYAVYETHECWDRGVVVLCVTQFSKLENGRGFYDNRHFVIFGFHDGKIVLWREFSNPDAVAHLQSRLT